MKMSSSFFFKSGGKSSKKRKHTSESSATQKPMSEYAIHRPKAVNEEILSSDESEYNAEVEGYPLASDEDEMPQDKRLRLAKKYLSEIKTQEAEHFDGLKINQNMEQRLQVEYLESIGKLHRNIAAGVIMCGVGLVLKHKLHHAPICSQVLSADGRYLYTGAKSQYVLKWSTESGKVLAKFDVTPTREDHDTGTKRRSHVIAITLSTDMKFLALAEGGSHIQIWCPVTMKHLKTFKGHRDIVSSLVFRKGSHELYSVAKDRSVKIWSLDEMAYVETLFGHQSGVTSIDALDRERAITAGGSDCSLRIWKIKEESQLIYNGHRDGIECVKFLNDEHFISGGVDGSIGLWTTLKKKPLCMANQAHGIAENGVANGITAIAVIVNTDLVASGSYDGYVRLWKVIQQARKLQPVHIIPISGFINSLIFSIDGTKLYVAVGKEHRLGRWWRHKEAQNSIIVVNVKLQYENTALT
ncbi:U3 small nucleolar RNA-interacting protein 2 [Scaptodrosophila lebanonensis]|uniref:U3 small nucleolar RNA-interacting protein 2 n=1 Tax=Drosophila lebanonensis TaxID=7225 RepID=A0A6J2TWS6_DROLE|nr:U3 small nucleolar RNA-interacting protein 2 [Scaptodrosophila lebanonensis]